MVSELPLEGRLLERVGEVGWDLLPAWSWDSLPSTIMIAANFFLLRPYYMLGTILNPLYNYPHLPTITPHLIAYGLDQEIYI